MAVRPAPVVEGVDDQLPGGKCMHRRPLGRGNAAKQSFDGMEGQHEDEHHEQEGRSALFVRSHPRQPRLHQHKGEAWIVRSVNRGVW